LKKNQRIENDSGGSEMNVSLMNLIKQQSAFFPLVMSFADLAMVLVHAAKFGVVYETDEGTAAHIFQVLMIAQIPIVALIMLTPAKPLNTKDYRVLLCL
jgi:hypothetical protein